MNICCASELTPALKDYLRLISDDFRCSSVFLKAKNRFPACGEKCLKQGAQNTISVMVIRCVRTYNNKKRELPNSKELEDSRFIIVVVARKAGNDHDINLFYISALQVLFGACIKESDLAFRKTRAHNESEMSLRIVVAQMLRHALRSIYPIHSQYNFDEKQ